jgi:hypothetical protein
MDVRTVVVKKQKECKFVFVLINLCTYFMFPSPLGFTVLPPTLNAAAFSSISPQNAALANTFVFFRFALP